ncbi:MMPL family transporter [bacterium]|nr:MMPL family transporter [bacterium]
MRGIDGVERVTATANEGAGTVLVELLLGANPFKALQDIKNAVDRIVSFPQDAERPIVSLLTTRHEVISLNIYGDLSEHTLRDIAETVRNDLIKLPEVTLAELSAARPLEISIEVPHEELRRYNLTLEQISNIVRRTAVELPGGGVKTAGGEILLRMDERRDFGSEFYDIPIVANPDGTYVRLGDIATIKDTFRETDQESYYFGKRSSRIVVYRIGDQTPIEVAAAVRAYAKELQADLPDSVHVALGMDWSEVYRDRVNLLLRNAGLGLIFVLFILGMFLEVRLAFWVTMGIPISFFGALLFLPAVDVSINMISLFAFIVTLGIVVDDAIVVGENIYEYRDRGLSYLQASIMGARQVAVPVTFSILTNVLAFTPILFVPGVSGKIWRIIPIIVITVFLISLIESLFILPAHLGHQKPYKERGVRYFLYRQQQKFSRFVQWFIHSVYKPVLRTSLHFPLLTLAIGLMLLAVTVGYVAGDRIGFSFMPKVDSDRITANLEMPFGTPVHETRAVVHRIELAAQETLADHGGEAIVEGLLKRVGTPASGGPMSGPSGGAGSHVGHVRILLVPTKDRDVTAAQFTREWRQRVGEIPGVEKLTFKFTAGPSGGDPINIELSHPDIETLENCAVEVAAAIRQFNGVKDVDDGFSGGKPQLDFRLTPEGRSLGLTSADIARQVRNAFYGAEAIRQQRDRNEVRVYVRLPREERESLYNVEELMIRTPQGGEIPLMEAAEVVRGRSYTRIKRADGRRVLNVTGDIVEGEANATKILSDFQNGELPRILAKYSGVTYTLEGEQKEQQETLEALMNGGILALIGIFAMLAIPFHSYIQPIIIMFVIPFGFVGAAWGHVIMGFDLSTISLMGIVALSGVVVNDSLVLIHCANENKYETKDSFEAVAQAGVRRFRPILLTSLTTFFGLAPMIFETSVQARFLIPMAISLGYGILGATLIVLFLVPSLYLLVDKIRYCCGFKESYEDMEEEYTDEELAELPFIQEEKG